MHKDDLLRTYAGWIVPILPLAQKAYGSRDSISPQHDASREYTRLLCEFYALGGSLIQMAEKLGVTYAGLRRRVTTACITPSANTRVRRKYTDEEYTEAIDTILAAKAESTETYHDTLKSVHDRGFSLTHIAERMGLSSAYPLYYGVNQSKIRTNEGTNER